MFNKKQITDNIEQLDFVIGQLVMGLNDIKTKENYDDALEELEKLVELRANLQDTKHQGSKFPIVFTGALQVGSILLILYYEKEDVITSKAFGMIGRLFKGA